MAALPLIAIAVAFAILAGLLLGLGLSFAGGIIAVLLFIGAAIWLVLGASARKTPAEASREVHRPRLLGPGGPDDPDR
jgi:hypothetical protein